MGKTEVYKATNVYWADDGRGGLTIISSPKKAPEAREGKLKDSVNTQAWRRGRECLRPEHQEELARQERRCRQDRVFGLGSAVGLCITVVLTLAGVVHGALLILPVVAFLMWLLEGNHFFPTMSLEEIEALEHDCFQEVGLHRIETELPMWLEGDEVVLEGEEIDGQMWHFDQFVDRRWIRVQKDGESKEIFFPDYKYYNRSLRERVDTRELESQPNYQDYLDALREERVRDFTSQGSYN